MLLTHLPEFFKDRRQALLQAHPGAAFLFPASPEYTRNPDVTFPFRQESGFFYLSGFEEPESFLVLTSAGGKPRMTLFARERDPDREMWDGERYGLEGAVQIFGADQAYPIHELGRRLPELLKGTERTYYRLGLNEIVDRQVFDAQEAYRRTQGRAGKALNPFFDPNEILGEMRLFKSAGETTLLRRACSITADAHLTLMKQVRPGMNEREVEARVDYEMRRQGCQRNGYGSIVAGGRNAACLHYRANNEDLRDGDLLLVDAGGERDYYTSDITRTFPIGRKFSDAQGKLYDLVLKSQLAAIEMTKPGALLPDLHRRVCEVLIDGMLSLGLMQGKPAEIFMAMGHKRFYPHSTSHWLGMDVHDVGLYTWQGEPRRLEAGMVFTIEPGFYVQPADREAPEAYRGIGIRIEDDVLVTARGCEVLTAGVPKDRHEIESIREAALQ